jgi:ligand-binding sensor domain-containing protein
MQHTSPIHLATNFRRAERGNHRITAFLFALLNLLSFTAAQPAVRFSHLTVDQGLSQDIVTSIVQDKRGFMWFATEDGLNRHDGYSIRVYKHNPRDPLSVASNKIRFLIIDQEGRLWAATGRALSQYDPDNDYFINTPIGVAPLSATLDDKGVLWIGTEEGLFFYDKHLQQFVTPRVSPAIPFQSRMVRALAAGGNGTLWVGTFEGLYLYSIESGRTEHTNLAADSDRLITTLLIDGHTLWIAVSDHGLRKLTVHSRALVSYRYTNGYLLDDRVLSLYRDRNGTVWIGTFSGLEKWDPATETFTHFRPQPDDEHALLGERVYSICEERAGALWVGTYRGGVNRLDPLSQQFELFAHSPADSRSLPSNDVLSVIEDQTGNLWVGTDLNGITRRVSGAAGFASYYTDRRWGSALALALDSSGMIWIGTNGSGAKRINPRTMSVTEFRVRPDGRGLRFDNVRALLTDDSSNIWIGYEQGGGLARYNPRTAQIEHFDFPQENSSVGIWHMNLLRSGKILLGTMFGQSGAYLFDRQTKSFLPVSHKRGALHLEAIRSSYEDSAGTLWMGSWGGGLFAYVPATDSIAQLTQIDGLANDYVKGILSDGVGRLWISTENGLSQFSTSRRTFRNFAAQDGLQSNFFWSGSCFKGRDGTLYFGGTKGLNAFRPEEIQQNPYVPPVVITHFSVLNQPFRPFTGTQRSPVISLPYDKNTFSFEFVALNFSSPEKNQYAYMMEGVDQSWILSGTRRYASYTHLDPGSYVFRVRGSNNDGLWNTTGDMIRLTILPPYWQTFWFRGLVILVFAATLYALYRYRVGKLVEMERLRGRIAADLHDDVGSELGHIALASQLLARKLSLPEHEQSQLASISTSALQASEMMRDIVWFLNPKNDSLDNIILRMRSLSESLLEGIDVQFETPEQRVTDRLDPNVKRNIVLMYKEVLYNIARHAHATAVSIAITIHSGQMRISVSDNGIGFVPQAESRGNGLHNLRHRAADIGAVLSIESAPRQGTRISLTIDM